MTADTPEEWTTLDTSTTYESYGGVECRTDRVRLPDSSEIDFEYIYEPDGVIILALTPDTEVVVITEWRQSVRRMVENGLPCGQIESGESPIDAAHRELFEESGYSAGHMELMTVTEPTNGTTDGQHYVFLATDCLQTGEPVTTADEVTVARVKPLSEVITSLLDSPVVDGKTAVAVLYYLQHR